MCARHVLLAAILLVCAPPNPSRGREVMVYVRDLGGCQSVIVARLTKVTAIPGGAARGETHVIELEPLATLAGVLDPSKTPSLTAGVDVEAFPGISSIHTAPAVGAYVLAVIWKVDAQIGTMTYRINSDDCDFMPECQGMLTIDGFGDKRVWQTLERLRKGRVDEERWNKANAERLKKLEQRQKSGTPTTAPKGGGR